MIQAGDIKLLASAVMDDVPEGGGAPTANVIDDGVSNEIFPDISELDRAGGRVNMRKIFLAVRTTDTDLYAGSNVIVAEPYQDPRVSVTLMSTPDFFDVRSEAASRLEAYLAKGPIWQGYLFGDHIAGQMTVSLLQRNEAPLPVIGQTLMLRKDEGLATQFDQYIRITDVEAIVRTFTDGSGDFQRTQVNLDISDSLAADFNGFEAFRVDSSINYTGKTKTFDTIVADAARYYGVKELEEAAEIGDFVVNCGDIFTQLVPSTRIEVPIADARLNQQLSTLVPAGSPYTRSLTLAFTTSQSMFIGGSILPSSLSVSRGGITVTDKGGILLDASSNTVGLVDYANGILTLSTNVFGTSSGVHNVVYTPAAQPTIVNQSFAERVTIESQRLSWVTTLDPLPTRGSLQVSYRAQGNWYTLYDDGSGALRGSDSSLGAGTINYGTGTVSVTLGALPDVDSAVVRTYASSIMSRPLDNLTAVGPSLPRALGKPFALGQAIKPGTLNITWNDGVARTATDSGGVLTGDATGTVKYAEGIVEFRPNLLPAEGTTITVGSTETVQISDSIANMTDGGANWTATLTAPLKPRSVELAVVASYSKGEYPDPSKQIYVSVRMFDDGSGNLLMANVDANLTVGTVDYSTGVVTIPKTNAGFKQEQRNYGFTMFGTWTDVIVTTKTITFLNGPGVNTPTSPPWSWWGGSQTEALEYRYGGTDGAGDSQSFSLDYLFLPANPNAYSSPRGYSEKITSFFIGTSLYIFNPSDNTWRRDPSPTTGVGTNAGVDAVIGGVKGVQITDWSAGQSSTPVNVAGTAPPSMTGADTPLIVDTAAFRTAVAPLVNAGFQVAGNFASTGTSFTATANSSGILSSGSAPVGETPGSYGVFGVIDYEMGLADLRFGRRVPASMAGGDYIIDISDLGIAGVDYIESFAVQADTLRYNATGYSYLPLDPEILGLNPVRLPADGRVPIFRPGTFAVIGHTGTISPGTVSNSQTISAGRTRLSRWRVIDEAGDVIDTGYTTDLDAGTITFTDVSGYDQPITLEHRIEDMVQVSDAQITGLVSFTRPLTHDFPLGSYISSAMIGGDVRARTSLVFDQVSWTGVWSDTQIGSAATGTFNHVANPITVNNRGALTERWAVIFTSSTAFQVIGEHVGVIAVGNTSTECSPLNTQAGTAYFTIPEEGWGSGWSTGNVMRFNTVGAMVPVWAVRTILQGPETVDDDRFTLLGRGDVDNPI